MDYLEFGYSIEARYSEFGFDLSDNAENLLSNEGLSEFGETQNTKDTVTNTITRYNPHFKE